jgi:hypothetical protein
MNADSNQVDAGKALEDLVYYYQFSVEKVRSLYTNAIQNTFSKAKFELVESKVGDGGAYAAFKNDKLKYTLYLGYKRNETDGALCTIPFKIAFVYNGSKQWEPHFSYEIYRKDFQKLYIPCWNKVTDWAQKAQELKPPAFNKTLPYSDKYDAITFAWDGINGIDLLKCVLSDDIDIANVTRRPLSEIQFGVAMLNTTSNVENDAHSFSKIVQNIFLEKIKSKKQLQDTIRENFN